jgi:hypothetical protein
VAVVGLGSLGLLRCGVSCCRPPRSEQAARPNARRRAGPARRAPRAALIQERSARQRTPGAVDSKKPFAFGTFGASVQPCRSWPQLGLAARVIRDHGWTLKDDLNFSMMTYDLLLQTDDLVTESVNVPVPTSDFL